MKLDGRFINENERMALLLEEEHALGMWLEYPSPTLLAARLVAHPTLAPPPSGAGAEEAAAASDDRDVPAFGSLEVLGAV